MPDLERLLAITRAEIEKNRPPSMPDGWIGERQPDIARAVADVEAKVQTLLAARNEDGLKKALRLLFKLHREAFQRYDAYRRERNRRLVETGFSEDELASFRALGIEVLIRTAVGEFWLVPAYTGKPGRVELTPEDALRVGLVPVLFDGRIESIGLDTDPRGSVAADVPPRRPPTPRAEHLAARPSSGRPEAKRGRAAAAPKPEPHPGQASLL